MKAKCWPTLQFHFYHSFVAVLFHLVEGVLNYCIVKIYQACVQLFISYQIGLHLIFFFIVFDFCFCFFLTIYLTLNIFHFAWYVHSFSFQAIFKDLVNCIQTELVTLREKNVFAYTFNLWTPFFPFSFSQTTILQKIVIYLKKNGI